MLEGELIAGKYEVVQPLGAGGMCEVYLARQPELGRMVALKLLRPQLAKDPRERKRFLREARNCAGMTHPNIVAVYEAAVADEQPFIAMEYVDGSTLERLIEEGIAPERALDLLEQICHALTFAHEKGIVHRDLKPANILVTGKGQVKVADWGLSKAEEDTTKLTKTGIVMGTPQYMAPEQIISMKTTPASDLYSLGVIIYQCIAGELPFADIGTVATLRAHLEQRPPDLFRHSAHCSPGLARLVASLLDKKPARRPSSASVVAQSLRSGGDGGGLATVLGPSAMARNWRGIVAPALSVAVVTVLALALWPRHGAEQPAPSFHGTRVLSLALTAVDQVTIRFEGEAQGSLALAYRDRKGRPLSGQGPSSVSLGSAVALSKTTFKLPVDLVPIPIAPFVLEAGSSSRMTSATLDPLPIRKALLASLRGLDGERTKALVSKLDKRMISIKNAEFRKDRDLIERDRAAIAQLLVQAGLGVDDVSGVARLVDGGVYLNSPLARKLMPLVRIEAVLEHTPPIAIPWGNLRERFGQRYERIKGRSGLGVPFDGYTVLERVPLASKMNNPRDLGGISYKRRFLTCFDAPSRRILLETMQVGAATFGHMQGEIPPANDELKQYVRLDFVLKPMAGIHWPPRQLFVCFTLRYIHSSMPLYFKINSKPPYTLVGTHDAKHRAVGATNPLGRFLVRVNPAEVKQGSNRILLFMDRRTLTALKTLGEMTSPPFVVLSEVAFAVPLVP